MEFLPKSCDTFVVLSPHTETKDTIVFGKNSDRPQNEVQEVVYVPSTSRTEKLKCTYIEIDCTGTTQAVILSKPSWMWGAEMGANESGVVIGNEAIWSVDKTDTSTKRLLGMDLLRLGLEYGQNIDEALDVIVKYLEMYGQGGPCSENDPGLTYHNSFLIAGPSGAWVLETVGKQWVAKRITEGFYNISNCLSITTKFDKHSSGLTDYAKENGLWNGEDDFDFALAFGGNSKLGCDRYTSGQNLLKELTQNKFVPRDMFKILRDKKSGLCRDVSDAFPTQGSQVSLINGKTPAVHWFTATPDPSKSIFKPFVFTPNVQVTNKTKSPKHENVPHLLYELHQKISKDNNNQEIIETLRKYEDQCCDDLPKVLEQIVQEPSKLSELDDLFKDAVETEVGYYR